MRKLCGLIAFGLVAFVVASSIRITRLGYTCAVCRLTRLDAKGLGLTYSTYYPNACSQWYPKHVEPVHSHIWEAGTCQYTRTLMGTPLSVSCSSGHYPIQLLPPSTQMRAYQHFKNPLLAKALFESLTDEKTLNDRLDEDDEDRGSLTVTALIKWEAAAFPGTWEEWWTKFYAKHVEEHKEWMTWVRSDSGTSFWEWQKQRKKKS